jgi:hypothetical protein
MAVDTTHVGKMEILGWDILGIALQPPTRPTDAHVHLDTVEHRTVSDRYKGRIRVAGENRR